jgi:glutamyl-tRNA synthetase
VPDRAVTIDDAFAGSVCMRPFEEVGDFVVWTRRGGPSYQLAVVVDDARQGVTEVVRGDDLLPSAARQALLMEWLGLPLPRWWHLPLVVGPDGRRLAKRHGDTRLASYRAAGVRPERIVGLLGAWCGVTAAPEEMSSADFLRRFSIDTLSGSPVTFTEDDHAWLEA